MKKIFLTDMDGTLLCTDKSISKENKEMVHALLDAGHVFAIASGRAYASLQRIIDELEVRRPGCFVVANNGAQVYDMATGERIRDMAVEPSAARHLYEEAAKWRLYIQSYSTEYILGSRACPEFDAYVEEAGSAGKVESPEITLQRRLPKILLVELHDRQRLVDFQEAHRDWQEGKCISFFSSPRYLEYCPIGSSKGEALQFLCERLDIPIENSFAIGDEENDLSMILAAGTGVAMCNAIPKVLEAADVITEHDHDHNGVAEIIRKYVL
jgi:Cof subfamily protein (haloacid dehalogenase superfamily)